MKKFALTLGIGFTLLMGCTQLKTLDHSSSQASNLLASQSQWQNIYNDGDAQLINGEMHLISKRNWFYITKKKYKNFILTADVKVPNINTLPNSGILFRAQVRDKDGYQEAYGYQAEIDPSQRKWSGGLYDQARRDWLNPIHETRSHPDDDFKQNLSPEWTPEKANAYKPNQWNHYQIECRGAEIKIFLNGVLTTHVIDTKDSEGYIGLQHHGSKTYRENGNRESTIIFKNVTITEL